MGVRNLAVAQHLQARRHVDASASPEEKLLMLEEIQELARELIRARDTLPTEKASK